MFLPQVLARIEKRYEQVGQWVERRQIRAFGVVAQSAGQGQIETFGNTAVLERNQMVYLVCVSAVIFVNKAILTAEMRPHTDFAA